MQKGIPGIRGTDHVGFNVPDIEQATEFFVDVIGCDYIYKLGPSSPMTTGWQSS